MKSFILLFPLLLSFSSSLNAKIITLNNNDPSPGQYSTFTAAHTAADTGDTILVQPSLTSYGDITILKPLTLIGSGHYPNAVRRDIRSFITTISIKKTGKVNLIGLTVERIFIFDSRYVYIGKCYVRNDISFGREDDFYPDTDVVTIENCFLQRVGSQSWINCPSLVISNCIFGDISSSLNYLRGSRSKLVKNNIFIGSTNRNTAVLQRDNNAFQNVTFSNNIFYGAPPVDTAAGEMFINCYFNNNLYYGFGIKTIGLIPPNGIPRGTVGANNLVNVNPRFIKYTEDQGDYDRLRNFDFRLQPNSPALNAGANGDHIGVHSKNLGFSYTGEPDIPHVYSVTIDSPIIPKDGKTKVNFKIRNPVNN